MCICLVCVIWVVLLLEDCLLWWRLRVSLIVRVIRMMVLVMISI